jgi:3-oxoacyl-[acyl-carrier-protein] synthase II
MPERRVVITGLGPVSAAGIGRSEFWTGLLEGRRGVRGITLLDPSAFPCRIAGELTDFDVMKYAPAGNKRVQRYIKRNQKVMARDIELAVAASFAAFSDAGLDTEPETRTIDPARLGCNIGAGLICVELDELGNAVVTSLDELRRFDLKRWGREGMKNLTPLWLLKYLPNMLACHVTILHDCQGPSNTITCAEASSHLAIGEALRTIQRGAADIAVCGGAETKLNCMGLMRQDKVGRLGHDYNNDPGRAVRPFDVGHGGTAIGEGAGLVVLEELEHAKRRGAKVYAEVIGFGAGSDAYSTSKRHPEGRGEAAAMAKALADAGKTAADIDLLVPFGSGVAAEDLAESRAIRTVFGDRAGKVPVTATKGGTGNCGAGAGALDVIAAALALREGLAPATVNCDSPDPECGLNVITGKPRPGPYRTALTACSALGGQSAALVLSRYE